MLSKSHFGSGTEISRRTLLTAMLGGCVAAGFAPGSIRSAKASPSSGGHLRLALAGGATTDLLDPRTFSDDVSINIGHQIMNGMVEVDSNGDIVPELLEHWEARPGAREWMFDVRKDVVFHNGKTLDADDIIYSINLHRGETKSGAKALLDNIEDIEKDGYHKIRITLKGGDADLPAILADYHMVVVPNGFTDWSNPIGTGGYKLENYQPGTSALARKVESYWKAGAANVDSIETFVVNDATARTSALISKQVDVANSVDGRTAEMMKNNAGFQVIQSKVGNHAIFIMNTTSDVFKDANVRQAMKYAIDREMLVKTILNGYGEVGNDHPIPSNNRYFNTELAQRKYDPDQAKFYLKKAGLDDLSVTLQISDASLPVGALDAAVLYQSAAKASGITINVKREPSDGYWDNIWMQVPFCAAHSGGRATVDGALSKAYKSNSAWNETFWKRESFDKIANEARAELDEGKRKELYFQCQQMISEDGGAITPMFMDTLEAGSARVKGWLPGHVSGLMEHRLGERVWLAD